ncbi:hypothetical protein [Jannaschia pohangensis]|uniref:Lipoprotein n=1 Tax=Jannaschia pohangensis TaxID=390807 RepID=A0A1I3R0M3_9RHOB|nr:hypothetical protein [Jannaschia pohangensis]SFJ39685.1 hypothetical protein SAMN04488095_2737 [Jannaschia pohangensis]
MIATLRKYALLVVAGATLAACQPSDEVLTHRGDGLPPVALSRALTMFETVCGGSLPDFASARTQMASVGVTRATAGDVIYSQSEDVSFRIFRDPRIGPTCSMIASVPVSEAAMRRGLMARYGTLAPSQFGDVGKHRGKTVLLLDPNQRNGRTYFNIRLLSER